MQPDRREQGFTLIELVTVIVLIGLLIAVAGPRFFENRTFTERGYVDELAASLRHAQQVAIATDCNVQFSITAAGFSAFQRNNQTTCRTASAWNRPVLRSDGRALAGVQPADVVATPYVFEFTNGGRLTVNNPPPIAVGPFTLTVDPIAGLVTVQ